MVGAAYGVIASYVLEVVAYYESEDRDAPSVGAVNSLTAGGTRRVADCARLMGGPLARTMKAWVSGKRRPNAKNLDAIEHAYRTVRRENVAAHLL
ncbi:hypothetical protein GCM10009612_51430 [Streptomyces beijiangensis]